VKDIHVKNEKEKRISTLKGEIRVLMDEKAEIISKKIISNTAEEVDSKAAGKELKNKVKVEQLRRHSRLLVERNSHLLTETLQKSILNKIQEANGAKMG